MLSMQVFRLAASYIESIESTYSAWNFGVFFVSSNEKFEEQMDFYDVFQKLFYVYSGLELVFLVVFFYLLAAVLKSLLIGLAQSIIVSLESKLCNEKLFIVVSLPFISSSLVSLRRSICIRRRTQMRSTSSRSIPNRIILQQRYQFQLRIQIISYGLQISSPSNSQINVF